jgi:hypothetical protein
MGLEAERPGRVVVFSRALLFGNVEVVRLREGKRRILSGLARQVARDFLPLCGKTGTPGVEAAIKPKSLSPAGSVARRPARRRIAFISDSRGGVRLLIM